MTAFSGLAAFPITPADASGQVDADALRILLKRLNDAGVASIGLLGSTGLYPFFSRKQRRRTIEIAVKAVAGRTQLLVGIGALRTDEVVALGRDAKAAGASAALLAPVSYTPLTSDEVFSHFETVARAVDMPICIYNNPGTTHFTFPPDLIARLSRIPGIVAVKNPAPPADIAAHLRDLKARTPQSFSLGYSVDWNATEAMIAGGDAWYSVLGGLFPAPCLAILAAVKAGDAAEARRLNARLQPLWDLFTEYSSLRVMYAATGLLGIKAELPRPLQPLPGAVCQRVAGVLATLGIS